MYRNDFLILKCLLSQTIYTLYCKLVQCIFVTTFFPKTLCWLLDSGHETCANVGSPVVTSSPLVPGPCLVHMKCGAMVTMYLAGPILYTPNSAASANCLHTIVISLP